MMMMMMTTIKALIAIIIPKMKMKSHTNVNEMNRVEKPDSMARDV